MKLNAKLIALVAGGGVAGFVGAPLLVASWINATAAPPIAATQPGGTADPIYVAQPGTPASCLPSVTSACPKVAIAPTSRKLTAQLGGAAVGALIGYIASRYVK